MRKLCSENLLGNESSLVRLIYLHLSMATTDLIINNLYQQVEKWKSSNNNFG